MSPIAAALKAPHSLRSEHEEIHAEITAAARLSGRLGETARAVAQAFHTHFAKEEEYALLPLTILPALAAGKIPPESEEIRMTAAQLEAQLPQMVREHRL